MDTATLRRYLDEPANAGDWLRWLGVADPPRRTATCCGMAASGLTLDLLAVICDQLRGTAAPAAPIPTWR